jgi:hypothetical protein
MTVTEHVEKDIVPLHAVGQNDSGTFRQGKSPPNIDDKGSRCRSLESEGGMIAKDKIAKIQGDGFTRRTSQNRALVPFEIDAGK